MTRHLILCGGLAPCQGENGQKHELTIADVPGGIDLRVEQLQRQMVSDIPDILIDLLEIAAYVYAADSKVRRGGYHMKHVGAQWRRQFQFAIPVRNPDLWSSPLVRDALVETIEFLADDSYDFRIEKLGQPEPGPSYFEFGDEGEGVGFVPDEIVLFSGGLDSFSGVLTELKHEGRRVALVSHRSSPKMLADQAKLLKALETKLGRGRLQHVPVRLTLAEGTSAESTHRTRSFLHAALGLIVARLFRRHRLRFYENGVTSLHLPISAHVLGARATRSTHPRVLAGLTKLFSEIHGAPFVVENPYFWKTKADIVGSIVGHGCGDLIGLTRSCASVRAQTTMHPHCGHCSQCIDRQFATLAAAAEDGFDPKTDYDIDLLEGPREPFEQVSMLASYVSTVSKIDVMSDRAFFATFGEASRVYRYLSDPAPIVGEKLFDLYKRHAASVCRVLDREIASNAAQIRANALPPSCLLMIAASQRSGQVARPIVATQADIGLEDDPRDMETGGRVREPEIFMAFDESGERVVIVGLGAISGALFQLLDALRQTFRSAREAELLPQNYPFLKTADLAHELNLDGASIRKRVSRFRNEEIVTLCKAAGRHVLPEDAIIENLPWNRYRLNPFRVRLVALSEIEELGGQL
jgi:7-cyano-7-deazaguanine synthase in queuosine biosynthesis